MVTLSLASTKALEHLKGGLRTVGLKLINAGPFGPGDHRVQRTQAFANINLHAGLRRRIRQTILLVER
ncbi:Putative uncharacterized protein [Lactobacillus delbrueckii subsp. lactis]|nr:Putative uncharacterized protein [Lactobacillus delbrueckii subsp. lactis]